MPYRIFRNHLAPMKFWESREIAWHHDTSWNTSRLSSEIFSLSDRTDVIKFSRNECCATRIEDDIVERQERNLANESDIIAKRSFCGWVNYGLSLEATRFYNWCAVFSQFIFCVHNTPRLFLNVLCTRGASHAAAVDKNLKTSDVGRNREVWREGFSVEIIRGSYLCQMVVAICDKVDQNELPNCGKC